VLAGHGAEAALLFEGDRWDQSLDGGRGGPVVSYPVSRRALLVEVARCALALRRSGLRAGDRVAINMPNIPEQVYWTEACKRTRHRVHAGVRRLQRQDPLRPHPQCRRAHRHHGRRRLCAMRR
jgi:hypothetical protein